MEGRAVQVFIGAGKVLADALEAVDVDRFPVLERLREIFAVVGGHVGVPLRLVGHEILAGEQGDGVAFLGEAVDVVGAVRVDAVADGGRFLELDVQVRVLSDDVVETEDPAGFGEPAQPLAVGDDDVVLVRSGLERCRYLLE